MTMLDGNAIAGTLRTVFGEEMTAADGTCAHCGASGPLAEVHVYVDAPGIVARCSHCEGVLLVIVDKRGVSCVDVSGFAALSLPGTVTVR
ncbi:DUF6510 family protein [Amycolatopsis sp. NPDC051903]|uniref:DUF6510 family protein n=1 Tax=Amycolatopsis sp. NPDC051903 TaxID=3363936 RepID=UPI00378D7DCA